ncbi:hypothetical protein QBC34DRAFT_459370 [Podospora aff. communis PSN243]|uniref:Single-strand DNA deaminase toxin A-like C-terminal domain-containing protein n=1 Tax=Podospora aff. communis PSN243 TaxID=3040156 RepID=A0AAV9GQS2_9PEZI|nr:hypothetical protein QBC34DRAFT_459370 [Podospora aff. communis PSN243]
MWDYSTIHFKRFSDRHLPFGFTVPPGQVLDKEGHKQRKDSLFAAIAVRWDDHNVFILCPFCKKIHRHGVSHFAHNPRTVDRIQDDHGRYTYKGPSPWLCQSRSSHCQYDPEIRNGLFQYTILFPFEEDPRVAGLSHEIDQEKQCFRTVGLDGILDSEDPEDQRESPEERDLRLLMRKMALEDGDYDVVTAYDTPAVEGLDNQSEPYSDTQPASSWIVFYATVGRLEALKKCIDDSPNPASLLRATTEDGISLLGLAASDGHLEVVKYLLERGCDVNAVDCNGRTPLMEAALWSQVRVVDMLLKAGADNDYERHRRGLVYKEDPYAKNRHRLLIRCLLGDTRSAASNCSSGPATTTHQNSNFNNAHFSKSQSAGTISLILPELGIKVWSQHKTAAVLLRGDPFPAVVAVSGWTGDGYDPGEFSAPEAGDLVRLNEGYWAFESIGVAGNMDLPFLEDGRDMKGVPGSYNACHAEAQLMAVLATTAFLLQPRNRPAEILVSNRSFTSCVRYAACIQERIGIEFAFKELPVTKS